MDIDLRRVPSVVYRPPVRALTQWLLVYVVPRVGKIGRIHLPQGSYLKGDDLAVIVSAGIGSWRKKSYIPHPVEPGDVVMVIRIHEVTSTNKQLQADLGDGFFFLRDSDLICVCDGAPRVRVERSRTRKGYAEWGTEGGSDGHEGQEGHQDPATGCTYTISQDGGIIIQSTP